MLVRYEIGDKVKVHMQIGNMREWRKGKVVSIATIYPSSSSMHRPYPMFVVECVRTYFNSVTKTYYDKLNQEGFVYNNQIKKRK